MQSLDEIGEAPPEDGVFLAATGLRDGRTINRVSHDQHGLIGRLQP
ncbi:MAG TPA: hypothetical protein VGR90_02650 [Acidimicrobiales bacterium]|nr:hypothetical protein [Acidimicrobiales bacterium]